MQSLGHVGIALASSLSAWINIALLVLVLARRGHYRTDARLVSRLLGIAGASVLMAGVLWLAAAWAVPWLSGPLLQQIVALTVLIIGGLFVYALAARLFGVYSIAEIKQTLRRAR